MSKAKEENIDAVHGRLMEAVHIAGYTLERAFSEFKWLVQDNKWKRVGNGYKDLSDFLATVNFSNFKMLAEQRKDIAQDLAKLGASQRATAKMLGVDHATVQRDLSSGANAPIKQKNASKNAGGDKRTGANAPPWFQSDINPAAELSKRAARQERRETKKSELKPPRFPDGKRALVYADPPWQYDFAPTDSRKIENQYPTATIDEIKTHLPVDRLADDCVLFWWATAPKLREALEVMAAWGFEYKTHAVWDKIILGMGYWFRGQHELLLVGTRGAPQPPPESQRVGSMLRFERKAHSAKPSSVKTILQSLFPHISKEARVEMYQREPDEDWPGW